jgi:hypothetical protein
MACRASSLSGDAGMTAARARRDHRVIAPIADSGREMLCRVRRNPSRRDIAGDQIDAGLLTVAIGQG